MNYVGSEADNYVKKIQALLAEAPREAGILFVSVRAIPTENGEAKEIDIVLGMRLGVAEDTGIHIAHLLLVDILKDTRKHFNIHIFSGIPGKGI